MEQDRTRQAVIIHRGPDFIPVYRVTLQIGYGRVLTFNMGPLSFWRRIWLRLAGCSLAKFDKNE